MNLTDFVVIEGDTSIDNILIRDGGMCCYCGIFLKRSEATRDHVIPKALGGKMTMDNVVICCHLCNMIKMHRTPLEWLDGVKPRKLAKKLAKKKPFRGQNRLLGTFNKNGIRRL
jgi:5-methylcytosine-specific restriction endonuclease McrA